ncbi:heparanase-like protein 1, partial [Rhodamnia argentea]|uniref:Heparanase-like protein 1 n=1 Tax=Rhodamnia argentea TaxID=178133 RepID=A0ABM3HJD6_9MYRT
MESKVGLGLVSLLLLSWLLSSSSSSLADDVKVAVKGEAAIATTDESFICATLDWWPSGKCDYGQCPWGLAGILNLDLDNKILSNAIKVFNPLRIRVGGSLQDQVVYEHTHSYNKKCPKFEKEDGGMFGFSEGCLRTERWDQLNHLFNQTGALVTFGLNALNGRTRSKQSDNLFVGKWKNGNARHLMRYTHHKGYKIDSYELGNELCGSGVSGKLTAEQYAEDIVKMKKFLTKLYPDQASRPKVLGPAGFYDRKWFETFLKATGPGVVDGVTHHLYNLGAGVDPTLIDKVQDPSYLDQIDKTYNDVSDTVQKFGPWTAPWVGEAGGAYNSGGKDVSNTFANGFWYLDQLGMASKFNHKVFCRQALIGGNYALLNTTTFIPNPDFYGALLWHRLMGKEVLSTTHNGSPYLRAYAHCSRNTPGVTVVLINMSNSTSFDVSIVDDPNSSPSNQKKVSSGGHAQREEYHLTPKDGNIRSDVLLLNGTPLKLTNSSDIPELNPTSVDASQPIHMAADSIVFARLQGFNAAACCKK